MVGTCCQRLGECAACILYIMDLYIFDVLSSDGWMVDSWDGVWFHLRCLEGVRLFHDILEVPY